LIAPSPPAARNAFAIRATHIASISFQSMYSANPPSIDEMSIVPQRVPSRKFPYAIRSRRA
jgi:hypothetical protein